MRAEREVVARDSGRKAQIVLDLRARARLSARSDRLQDENLEPLRSSVHAGRQSSRTGSDDHQIAHGAGVDRGVEAEALGDPSIRRIAQHLSAAADEDGRIVHGDAESVQYRLSLVIAVDVD